MAEVSLVSGHAFRHAAKAPIGKRLQALVTSIPQPDKDPQACDGTQTRRSSRRAS